MDEMALFMQVFALVVHCSLPKCYNRQEQGQVPVNISIPLYPLLWEQCAFMEAISIVSDSKWWCQEVKWFLYLQATKGDATAWEFRTALRSSISRPQLCYLNIISQISMLPGIENKWLFNSWEIKIDWSPIGKKTSLMSL